MGMNNEFEYYYNNNGTRNNLVYTSLISKNKRVFCQWYYNDGVYHKGQNEIVDPHLMEDKFRREVEFLSLMNHKYPDLIPRYTVDIEGHKIYLEVDGVDFWNRADCKIENYNKVVPDWQDQMLEILYAHRDLGIHKYSMHPSSYFVVDGRLKSMNYFFAHKNDEPYISVKDVESHIHTDRQSKMKQYLSTLGIEWDKPQSWETLDRLCWNSFRTNYPEDFIEKALNV
jgi:hypothetical protein